MNATPFEAGYHPVAELRPETPIDGCARWRIGARAGLVRIESDDDRAWEFDLEGRLLTLQEHGESRRTTLDLRLWGHEVVAEGSERRLRRLPTLSDGLDRIVAIHALVRELYVRASPKNCVFLLGEGDDVEAAEWVEKTLANAARWDRNALVEDREALRRIYRPISVLPPDQYAALVVQISEGCSWDRCEFCSLYKDVPYRERSVAEVEAHLDALLAHLGESAGRFSRVFLGQANALLRDTNALLEIFGAIRERIALVPVELEPAERRRWLNEHKPSMTGMHSFVDAFHRVKTVEEWTALREAGLRRVYLGLESGDEELVRSLGKPLAMERAVELAERLHAAGLRLGVILLTGIGDMKTEARHRDESVRIVTRMRLLPGDQVYLSPLVHPSGGNLAFAPDGSAVHANAALTRMREALRPVLPRGVPIARYDLPRLQERVERV